MKNKLTLLEIELIACKAECSLEDFSSALWIKLFSKQKGTKAQVNRLAKDLNIYPHTANVHEAIINHLTNHIQ